MKNMRKGILMGVAVLFLCSFPTLKSTAKTEKGTAKINWVTWAQMQEAQKKNPKKVFVDIYTDWCGWCKRMDKTTFENPLIIQYLNDNFYAIKFDAETKDELFFKEKKYGSNGKFNDLAVLLMNNQMSFPTSVYLDEKLTPLTPPIGSYLDPKQLEVILNYFGSNSQLKVPFNNFEKNFKGQIK